jgi:phosphoribulokinase
LGDEHRGAVHLKLMRDEDGKPVDALHVHAYADRKETREVEKVIWGALGVDAELPDTLGVIGDGDRSEPLAVVQLILLSRMLMARRHEDIESNPPAPVAPT